MDWGLFAGLGADALAPHVDEGQIKLDTRRSFVVYPPGASGLRPAGVFVGRSPLLEADALDATRSAVSQRERERLQLQLHAMLLTVFRRHPTLRYFQVRPRPSSTCAGLRIAS